MNQMHVPNMSLDISFTSISPVWLRGELKANTISNNYWADEWTENQHCAK